MLKRGSRKIIEELDKKHARLLELAKEQPDEIERRFALRKAKIAHAEKLVTPKENIIQPISPQQHKYLLAFALLPLLPIGILGAVLLSKSPSFIGAATAVESAAESAMGLSVVREVLMVLLGIVGLGVVLVSALYYNEHRYDKYKPQ